MQLSISNLAWPPADDKAIAGVLRTRGIFGVELAPTKIWPRPLEASVSELAAYRGFWNEQGVRIVALQALLFRRPDLTIFENATARNQTFTYLAGMCELAERLGAGILVFGSPRNRRIGMQTPNEVEEIALEFFGGIGAMARQRGVAFCIEPNPTAYECDFITNAEQGARLVRAVGDDGFGLHLDAAGMVLAGDGPVETLAEYGPSLRHFHVSEPYLRPVGEPELDHSAIGSALKASGYAGWISIEMKAPENQPPEIAVDRALQMVQRVYS